MREGARLCAGLGSAPRIQQGEREMGVLCLAALCPSQFGRAVGVWLSLGAFLHLGLLCCSCAAVSCCHGGATIHHLLLWHLCEWHAALVVLMWQQ